jgi:hypothetical protein
MQRRNFILTICAAVGFLVGAGQAQAKPNFSGEWKLNIEKSNFGPIPPPDSQTQKIQHEDPSLKIAVEQKGGPQGDFSYESSYSTDGKETTNTIGPMEAKSTCKWDGEVLAVETKINAGGADIVIKGKWSLSADGKVLTNAAHIVSPQGELDVTSVFEKK